MGSTSDTRQAMRKEALLDDLLFFLDHIRCRHPDGVSDGVVSFTADHWVWWWYQDGEPAKMESAIRKFMRWKTSVIAAGVEVSFARDTNGYHHRVDATQAQERATAARGRSKQMQRAHEELTGRRVRLPGRPGGRPAPTVARSTTATEAARTLGVPYTTILSWVGRMGAPVRRVQRGRSCRLFVDVAEIRAWLAAQEDAGRRVATSSWVRSRIPATRAWARISAVQSGLGMSDTELAEKLGVSRQTLNQWRNGTTETIPTIVVVAAEELAQTEDRRVFASRRGPVTTMSGPGLQELLDQNGGSATAVARRLGLGSPASIVKVADALGLRRNRNGSHLVTRVGRRDIREAVDRARSVKEAARILGLPHSSFRGVVADYGMAGEIAETIRNNDRARIEVAIEEGGRNRWTRRQIRERTGFGRGAFDRRVAKYGLGPALTSALGPADRNKRSK